MSIGWQDILAMAVVAVSAGYLAWRGRRALARRKAGCGACASCPSEREPSEPNVVSITTNGRAGE